MNGSVFALGAALLLATSGLALAQGETSGTVILPAGQSLGGAGGDQEAQDGQPAASSPAKPVDATEKKDAASSETASPQVGASGTEDAKSSQSQDAAANPDKSADATQSASGDPMAPDIHPSLDTATEGNEPTLGDLAKNADPAGNPTYAVSADGTVDWYTWRGFKKYGANCLQCHGPDGMGSSFAPNLTESLQSLSYYDFAGIVVGGQQNKWNSSGNSVMPAWGEDPNVMCSLDAIYIYLRSRTDGVVGRGEPKRPGKTDANKAAQQEEYDCLGF